VPADADADPDDDSGVEGWVVRGSAKMPQPGVLGRRRAEGKHTADEKNRKGEALFRAGEYEAAVKEFAAAVAEFAGETTYLNNLGAALHALGCHEEAWRRLREALYLDPFSQSARDNLRKVAADLGKESEAERLLRLFGADHP
jgi:Flp pilus assembly protein TadD